MSADMDHRGRDVRFVPKACGHVSGLFVRP